MATRHPAARAPTPPVSSAAHLDTALQDPARLAALDAAAALEAGPDPPFDRFARLASRVAETPVALVSIVSDERQYFAGLCGLPQPWADARETPLRLLLALRLFRGLGAAGTRPRVIGAGRIYGAVPSTHDIRP